MLQLATMPGEDFQSAVSDAVAGRARAMVDLLRLALRFPSVSGNEEPFTRLLAQWGEKNGLVVDLWQATEADLADRFGPLPRHIPLANRPTLVLALPGRAELPSLMFNGHTDVVDAPEPAKWKHDPWGGHVEGSVVFGRGACDVRGPIVSALWAMMALGDSVPQNRRGRVSIELVPGEEDCVGLGTRSSIQRGHRADGVIVLEPTEGQPRCASRGGLRFEIAATGRAVHGTLKWLGVDAIRTVGLGLAALATMERRWNERPAAPLFSDYPLARPVTVDRVEGGRWQGMICDHCTCAGYLELLPSDDAAEWKQRFRTELEDELRYMGEDPARVKVTFTEEYAGHETPTEAPVCRVAEGVMARGGDAAARWSGWRAFNSGCEAGARATVLGEPTLVWGPGSLEFAHAVDERIDLRDVELAARRFAEFAVAWADTKEGA